MAVKKSCFIPVYSSIKTRRNKVTRPVCFQTCYVMFGQTVLMTFIRLPDAAMLAGVRSRRSVRLPRLLYCIGNHRVSR